MSESTPEQKAIRARELNDLGEVLSIPAGRRLLWRLITETRVFGVCYTGNSDTFFRLGKREVGLLFFNDMVAAAPELWKQMMVENGGKPTEKGS